MSAESLKPCPFCGGQAEIDQQDGLLTVFCGLCGCFPGAARSTLESDAIAGWNRRAPRQHGAEAMSAERERLASVLEENAAFLEFDVLDASECRVVAKSMRAAAAALRSSEPQGERAVVVRAWFDERHGQWCAWERPFDALGVPMGQPATLTLAPVESVRAPLTQNEDPIE